MSGMSEKRTRSTSPKPAARQKKVLSFGRSVCRDGVMFIGTAGVARWRAVCARRTPRLEPKIVQRQSFGSVCTYEFNVGVGGCGVPASGMGLRRVRAGVFSLGYGAVGGGTQARPSHLSVRMSRRRRRPWRP